MDTSTGYRTRSRIANIRSERSLSAIEAPPWSRPDERPAGPRRIEALGSVPLRLPEPPDRPGDVVPEGVVAIEAKIGADGHRGVRPMDRHGGNVLVRLGDHLLKRLSPGGGVG